MLLIRAATEQDAGAIAHVHVDSWRTTYAGIVPDNYLSGLNETERVPMWREWLGLDIHVYVADMASEIVGFICGGQIREPLADCDAELFAIYLLQRAQGQGIGTALFRRLAESLRADGFKSMAVWVLESNSSSSFYKKSGALRVQSKEIDIGGAMLSAVAFMWPDLELIPPPH